mmetsp:Transcript_42386/g.55877  ORF Transcript_42386/g.55877 Transcript_42386/m.55877 type:complete len:209 (+) Transcript_42386:642-1268(+)
MAFQAAASRRTLNQSLANHFGTKGGMESDEREELTLYLFKSHARNKMLAFKRILPSECPLRMLPLDYLETLDEDGFDLIVSTTTTLAEGSPADANQVKKKSSRLGRAKKSSKAADQDQPLTKSIYILCFVSMVQIEAYLKAHGLLKGSDNIANQQEFSQLSKSIMTNTRWERKGKLKKKNLNTNDFKERYFELVRDNLYYYKSERTKE